MLYATAAASFQTNHGYPAKSPWCAVPFSEFPQYEAPRFMDALLRLMGHARDTTAAVTRHAGIGVEDVASFEKVARLADKLPDLPDFDLTLIVDADLEDLLQALEARSEHLKVEEELNLLPDLRHEDLDRLAIAAAHVRTEASAPFLDQTPGSAYDAAEAEIIFLEELASVIEGVAKPLSVLGVRSDMPTNHVPAAASAAYVLGSAPPKAKRWIVELPHASMEDVVAAQERWKNLLEAEVCWASKATGYRQDGRPEPEQLVEAARTLRKTGIRKLFASMRGEAKAARSLAHKIGIDPDPDRLEAMAHHVEAVRAFEQDETMAALFGRAWDGVSTPIDDMRDGLQLRDLMLKTVSTQFGAAEVTRQAMKVAAADMTELERYQDACKAAFSLSPEKRKRLGEEPFDRFVAGIRRQVQALKAFLAVDVGRRLIGVDAPFRRIAYTHSVAERARRVTEALAAHAEGDLVIRIGKTYEAIETVRKAVAWTNAVKCAELRPDVQSALISRKAARMRDDFRRAADDWKSIENSCASVIALLSEFGAQELCDLPPEDVFPLVERLIGRENELADFVVLRDLRTGLERHGLKSMLDVCEELEVDPRRLADVFEAIVADRKASEIRREEPLRSTNGTTLQGRRETFRKKDKEKIINDRDVIKSLLVQARPPAGSAYGPKKGWTEMQLLRNEFDKQKRFTPVRQLLGRAGTAIQALKPCFMMSPLSVAKFVPGASLHFDMLVIDEASQMRPEDALGGLLRTSQIVVVGDTKQLPPTDFFARAETVADDEPEDDVDAESILEACEKTFGQRRRLKWHYRSRCESLIAFSNGHFYDNGLITFPMARPGSFSIELVRVDGHYQGQRNPAEARRVAEEAIAFMRHQADLPDRDFATLGIVAVNIPQKEMIEDELRLLCADDELVERYEERARDRGEPLFCKNLENVQGDERDHIFISLTYGKKSGEPSLSQNFGPINRSQGHRRLNVLFTRARIRIGLFTSFGSADVQPKEGKPGINALHAYLAYAESRGRASAHVPSGTPDSDFETEVADRLRLRGYQVDLQVGVSRKEQRGKNFRIDLAVHHPDMLGHYLAGVECDGATYHSSKSARDRDRLREEVLNSLGWELVRVWSTDWFDNPSRETDKLVVKLEELRRRPVAAAAAYPPLHRDRPVMEPEQPGTDGVEQAPEANPEPRQIADANVATTSAEKSAAGTGKPSLEGGGPLTQKEAASALEALRDLVIAPSIGGWEPERSLLRPAMIETFVSQKIADPEDWSKKVPMYLRQGTNPIEKKRYLDQVCEVIERMT